MSPNKHLPCYQRSCIRQCFILLDSHQRQLAVRTSPLPSAVRAVPSAFASGTYAGHTPALVTPSRQIQHIRHRQPLTADQGPPTAGTLPLCHSRFQRSLRTLSAASTSIVATSNSAQAAAWRAASIARRCCSEPPATSEVDSPAAVTHGNSSSCMFPPRSRDSLLVCVLRTRPEYEPSARVKRSRVVGAGRPRTPTPAAPASYSAPSALID